MTVVDADARITSAGAATSEGSQELRPRGDITQKELMREAGAVLRMSESAAAADRKSTRLNSSHVSESRMPSSA